MPFQDLGPFCYLSAPCQSTLGDDSERPWTSISMYSSDLSTPEINWEAYFWMWKMVSISTPIAVNSRRLHKYRLVYVTRELHVVEFISLEMLVGACWPDDVKTKATGHFKVQKSPALPARGHWTLDLTSLMIIEAWTQSLILIKFNSFAGTHTLLHFR